MRAVGGTVEALRAIQRYGATSMLEQAFAGFAALPPAGEDKKWWHVLGVAPDCAPDEIRARHRELVLKHHPDRGGDPVRMVEINKAVAVALGGTT
jgi:DnaJ-domain-containing protein 1